jgi:methyl-accepting chemotaxis protein
LACAFSFSAEHNYACAENGLPPCLCARLASLDAQSIADAWKASDEVNSLTRSIVTTSNWVIVVALGAGILMGVVMAWVITRSITRPINRIIEGLSSASDQVSAAAGEVSSASQQLAEGTSQQAASIKETSSSLEEMSSMTRQNADNAVS